VTLELLDGQGHILNSPLDYIFGIDPSSNKLGGLDIFRDDYIVSNLVYRHIWIRIWLTFEGYWHIPTTLPEKPS